MLDRWAKPTCYSMLKKNLTTESRKFVYIDLSNKFDTERECYNYIIDSILDVHDDELWEIRGDIDHLRDRTKVDHLSYTKSLLLILSALNTELVIILDEIDALRSTKYSDNIFAVIRSNYFARSNFPKFEQLTYILSGVIEPKDLIRDKNKSPFNIGEKIYLDDFTYEEFLTFIRKSKLCISSEVIQSIYEWTSGNPRLTFDICSELESMIIEGGKINRSSIEEIVNKKYFSNFDVAPIDHIRELVSDDSDVQSAVYKIVENKDNEEALKLSDGTKKPTLSTWDMRL
ncbi:AAA-like domain-containing protein [Vibrio lentus]|nr:AAA-like domain-containing protein [Vibrio lentus]